MVTGIEEKVSFAARTEMPQIEETRIGVDVFDLDRRIDEKQTKQQSVEELIPLLLIERVVNEEQMPLSVKEMFIVQEGMTEKKHSTFDRSRKKCRGVGDDTRANALHTRRG